MPDREPTPGQLHIAPGTILEKSEYTGLEHYFNVVLRQIEHGRKEYAKNYLEKDDDEFVQEIAVELADVCGWSAMRFLKLLAAQELANVSRADKWEGPCCLEKCKEEADDEAQE